MTTRANAIARCLPAVGLAAASVAIADGLASRDVVRLVLVLAWSGCAVLVAVGGANAIGGLVAAGATCGAVAALADLVARDAGSSSVTVDRARVVTGASFGVAAAIAMIVLLALPDGRIEARVHRSLALALLVAGVVCGIASFADAPVERWWPAVSFGVLGAAAGVFVSHGRYRRASAIDQRRMQWFGLSLAVAAEVSLLVIALHLIVERPSSVVDAVGLSTMVVAAGLAMSSSRRYVARVDRALTYAVSFTGLTVLVLGIYALVVVGFGHPPTDGERDLLLASMVAAGVAALAYPEAQRRLTVMANRVVYGERSAPDEAIRGFGTRLTRATPMDELLLQLCESLRKTMRLRSAEVWTGAEGAYDVAAGVPHRDRAALRIGAKEIGVVARAGVSGGTWVDVWLGGLAVDRDAANVRVAPLAHAGNLLGLIVCERAPDGEPFGEDADTTLAELARQVALALHNVQLDSALQASLDELKQKNVELTSSRARIVAAGDAARRKLERNLHDGAQQHLVALAVKARLARDAVEDDPADAMELLDELRGDLQEAIAELRALAHGIFPPLLMSGGLAEALPAAATRAAQSTTVDVSGVGRYDSDLEAAVYFCCLEALQNAGKHAGEGATIAVRVWIDDDTLRFTVADDGVGFDMHDGRLLGHGFVNMADRLGAIDGRFDVSSKPGAGTCIAGAIPLAGRAG